jgi:TRAP-type C4-dicarboxylate transport system permease small subunit
MNSGKIGRVLERITHKLYWGMALVAAAVIMLMTLLITADVIGRYTLNSPIEGAGEMVELMMVVVVFFGIGYRTLQRGHVAVDVLSLHFSKRTNAILDVMFLWISAIIVGLITWRLGLKGWESAIDISRNITLQLEIPTFPFYWIASLGSLLTCIAMIINSFLSLVKIKGGSL